MGMKLVTLLAWCAVSLHAHKLQVKPSNYFLSLQLDTDLARYNGSVTIDFEVLSNVNNIKIHSEGLDIVDVSVRALKRFLIRDDLYTMSRDKLEIELGDSTLLPNETHEVQIHFKGKIEQNLIGFYKTKCYSQQSNSWLASTLLEPTYARRVYPCFDGPSYSTPLTLNVTLNDSLNVLSSLSYNGSSIISTGLKTEYFTTRSILPHQVAWAVYDPKLFLPHSRNKLQALSCQDGNDQLEQVQQMSDIIAQMTGIQSSSKLDIVVSPDLPVNSRSSPNLLLIREEVFWKGAANSEDNIDTLLALSEAAADQVFGAIITFDSWSDLWLIKGLSYYFKYKIALQMSSRNDSKELLKRRLANEFNEALRSDSLRKNRCLSDHLHSGKEIASVYESSLFAKAAFVIIMLEDIMTEENFLKGVTTFIQETKVNHSGIANTDRFISTLNRYTVDKIQTNVTLLDLMSPWIHHQGYPVVNAQRNGNKILISQKSINSHITRRWWVPITLKTSSKNMSEKYWLHQASSLTITLNNSDQWYIINADSKGFYRINYDLNNWQRLWNAYKNLSENARVRLLDDSLSLARADLLPYPLALKFVHLLANETCVSPWLASIHHLSYIRSSLQKNDQEKWDEYISILYNSSNQLSNDSNIKTAIADMLCDKQLSCSQISSFLLPNSTLSYEKSIQILKTNSSMRSSYYLCSTIKSNQSLWEKVLSEYEETKSPIEKQNLLSLLTCTSNKTTLIRLLDLFITENTTLKRQDFLPVIRRICYSDEGAATALQWFQKNSATLKEYMPRNNDFITNILKSISQKIFDTSQEIEVTAYFNSLKGELDGFTVSQIIEQIKMNIIHKQKFSSVISNWLTGDPNADFIFNHGTPLQVTNICLLFVVIFVNIIIIMY